MAGVGGGAMFMDAVGCGSLSRPTFCVIPGRGRKPANPDSSSDEDAR